jgi:Tol biopolymer transport system component
VPITGGEGSKLVGGPDLEAFGASLSPQDAGASLSPDGSLLSYVCAGPHQAGFASDLCLANADGSDPRIVAGSPPHYGIMDASWSPDGTRLAYWTFHSWNVKVIDIATGETTHVANGAYPSWVDDHTLIIEPYFGGA